MAAHLLRRIGTGLLTIIAGTIAIFFLVRLIPGDPIQQLLDRAGSAEAEAALRRLYRLDEPIPQQLMAWVRGLMQGDFGYSIVTRAPVFPEVASRVPRTLYLMAGGIAVALAVSVPAAFASALHRDRMIDRLSSVGTSVLLSVPRFWLGILLISVFAVQLRWFPTTGFTSAADGLFASVRAAILPWVTIGLPMSAFITRVLRSSLLDEAGQDYMLAARSRGLGMSRSLWAHGLRNAAIPAVTVVGLEIGYLLGGAIVVEQVFAYPGMGQLIVNSILQRDYPTVQISLLFFLTAFVVVNVITDVCYGVINPRMRIRTR